MKSSLINDLEEKSRNLRKIVLEMCYKAKTGHVTSSFSCIEILVALYYGKNLKFRKDDPKWSERDRFILSKGQASPILYAILGDLGFYSQDEIWKFCQKDGIFGVHLQQNVPGVEITSGSLGHGLGIATGMALSLKNDRKLPLVYALLGDGECYEGSIWESAMFASQHSLNNLVVIIDRNYMCATDFTENFLTVEPLVDKWKSFGFETHIVDGHSIKDLLSVLSNIRTRTTQKPAAIIAKTVKGKGIDFISNKPLWHAVTPSEKEIERAREELEKDYEK